MNCHSQIWTNAPMLEPVRESFRTGNVHCSGRASTTCRTSYTSTTASTSNKGVGCNTCHGPVDQMPLMYQADSLQMEWCLDCHRAPDKFLRPKNVAGDPRDQVFNMTYEQPTANNPVTVTFTNAKRPPKVGLGTHTFTDQRELGKALLDEYNIRAPREITSCSTCHR